ncbi:MAG TPA: amidohydrolase family protein [Vicinamibacterales bacterium]|nr:amidohydrolase family protein [Vicinamibacterales bacterium]
MNIRPSVIAALVTASASLADARSVSHETPQAPAVVLRAAGMIDVQRGVRIEDVLVVVTGDRITAVGPARTVAVPPGAQRIELGNATLLPGLIDLHVHLTLAGNPEANAKATLLAGFTTVQDLGALNYRNLELRDAIAAGTSIGPRVVASGPWIGLSGGICDFSGIGVRGVDEFRRRVREDVARGADLIKVCVSGWLQDAVNRPEAFEIGEADLAAAIDEAHKARRRVAVHALSRAGIRAAVAHGADLVVHGGFADPTTIREMQKRGVRQLPTLFSLTPAATPAAEALLAHMKTSVGLGLPVAFGTDAGVIPHGRNAEEFALLTRIGLTPAAAIRSATLDAAQAIGWDDRIGSLSAGKLADLIAVDGNPLEDLSVLKRVVLVMRGGQIFKGQRAMGKGEGKGERAKSTRQRFASVHPCLNAANGATSARNTFFSTIGSGAKCARAAASSAADTTNSPFSP